MIPLRTSPLSRPRCRSSSFLSTIRSHTRAVHVPRLPDEAARLWAAFRLTHPDRSAPQRSLHLAPEHRACDVAAWLRHAASEASLGWNFGSNRLIVHGHREDIGAVDGSQPRFSYLALPSLADRGAGAIARGMIVAAPDLAAQLAWVSERMADVAVSWHGQTQVVLRPMGDHDPVVGHYVGASTHWTTVTPVVLPGHHDGSSKKAERLLRKAFRHAGLRAADVDGIRSLVWRDRGFHRGVGRADDYRLPDKIHGPRFHVLVEFDRPVAGPLFVGSGRHRGLGLFARVPANLG
jgi:CRISPR-associated protein Csb2